MPGSDSAKAVQKETQMSKTGQTAWYQTYYHPLGFSAVHVGAKPWH